MRERINQINKQIYALEAEKKAMLNAWLAEKCPHKVGDVVKIQGYAYTGKDLQIAKLFVSEDKFYKPEDPRRYKWKATGPVLKKDGTPGQNYGETYEIMPD